MSNMTRYVINEGIRKIFGGRLSSEDLDNMLAKPSSDYELWLQEKTMEAVSGLKDECYRYIRGWGNGGGSYSTQECVQNALSDANTDVPKVLAGTILEALTLNGEPPLEATILTMNIINDSLAELEFRSKDEKLNLDRQTVEREG